MAARQSIVSGTPSPVLVDESATRESAIMATILSEFVAVAASTLRRLSLLGAG